MGSKGSVLSAMCWIDRKANFKSNSLFIALIKFHLIIILPSIKKNMTVASVYFQIHKAKNGKSLFY